MASSTFQCWTRLLASTLSHHINHVNFEVYVTQCHVGLESTQGQPRSKQYLFM
jgi:hypothetical protein